MIRAVEHVAIAAKDTNALARSYCSTLGFSIVVAARSPQSTWSVGPPGERRLTLVTDPEGNLLQLVYRPRPLLGS